ncbi:MAG: hypothetical protein AAGD43_11065 [Pseudomonadota bacterium]
MMPYLNTFLLNYLPDTHRPLTQHEREAMRLPWKGSAITRRLKHIEWFRLRPLLARFAAQLSNFAKACLTSRKERGHVQL